MDTIDVNSLHESQPGERVRNPFDVLRQAAADRPSAATSRAVRTLYLMAAATMAMSVVLWVTAYGLRSEPVSWLALISSLTAALAVLGASVLEVVPHLRELRDPQAHFLKHLGESHARETDTVQRLAARFTLHRLQDTEARLTLTIAQGRRRMPLALPFEKLATPAAVAVVYVTAPKLGMDVDAQLWPSWLFVTLLALSCLAVHHHLCMDALERAALLLQRAIAIKHVQKEA